MHLHTYIHTYNYFHAAETCFKNWQSLNRSRKSPFLEFEGSCPCSQEFATVTDAEPHESSSHLTLREFKIHFNIIPSYSVLLRGVRLYKHLRTLLKTGTFSVTPAQ